MCMKSSKNSLKEALMGGTKLTYPGKEITLPSNEKGSLKRLEALIRKLEKQPGMLKRFNDVI